jgi:N-acetyl-gamma-glutamylphosphate reductase
VTPEHRHFRESWLIVDDSAYMRIRNPERFEGYYELDNKLECRSYYDAFIEMWETCEQDQNTRRLSL